MNIVSLYNALNSLTTANVQHALTRAAIFIVALTMAIIGFLLLVK